MGKQRSAASAKLAPAARPTETVSPQRGRTKAVLGVVLAVGAGLSAAFLGSPRAESGPRAWRHSAGRAARYASGSCGVPVVDAKAFSAATFAERFLEQSPLLVRGLTAAQAASRHWDRAVFASEFGGLDAQKTVPLYTAQFGTPLQHKNRYAVSLQSYLDDIDRNGTPALLLDRTRGELGKRVLAKHGVPEAVVDMSKDMVKLPVVSLGVSGAGLALHQHAQTWLSLLRGRKIWFFMAPDALQGHSAYETLALRAPADWSEEALPSILQDGSGLHVCEQLPGDMMYVPSYWYHATENDGEVLGIGMQQTDEAKGSKAAFAKYPRSAYLRDSVARETINAIQDGKAGNNWQRKAEAALKEIAAAIELEPLEFRRRSVAAKVRAQVVQLRGGDLAQVLGALFDEWETIEKLAYESAERGALSQPQLASILCQLGTDATTLMPAGEDITKQVVEEFHRKAQEAHAPTYEGFLKKT